MPIIVPNTCFNGGIHSVLYDHGVHMPNSVTYLNWTPIFEWCVVRCGSNNGHQTNICSKVIGPMLKIC